MTLLNRLVCLVLGHQWTTWVEPEYGRGFRYLCRTCQRCGEVVE